MDSNFRTSSKLTIFSFRRKYYNSDNIIADMNNATHLAALNLKPEDIWETEVLGLMEEAQRCYRYHPKGKRSIGFGHAVSRSQIASPFS